jgi:quercetin dioxygenase-like cupin family protein
VGFRYNPDEDAIEIGGHSGFARRKKYRDVSHNPRVAFVVDDVVSVNPLEKGKFEVVHLGGLTVGRATYQPGWRWSEHVGPTVGAKRCAVAHVGLVVSGTATAALEDGRVFELRAGELFYIPQVPHDSWVVGDEPYVSLHFQGADHYAK